MLLDTYRGAVDFIGPMPMRAGLVHAAGVYAFLLREPGPGAFWRVIYVGQAEALDARGIPDGHHAFRPALRMAGGVEGRLGLAVHIPYRAGLRYEIEAELIRFYRPPLNHTQPRTLADALIGAALHP